MGRQTTGLTNTHRYPHNVDMSTTRQSTTCKQCSRKQRNCFSWPAQCNESQSPKHHLLGNVSVSTCGAWGVTDSAIHR